MNSPALRAGLWVHAPVAPTPECVRLVKELDAPVEHIVLPTYAYEHKAFVGPFSRAFPKAKVCAAKTSMQGDAHIMCYELRDSLVTECPVPNMQTFGLGVCVVQPDLFLCRPRKRAKYRDCKDGHSCAPQPSARTKGAYFFIRQPSKAPIAMNSCLL